jgi:tRNA/rRNA methyltransferase
MHIPTAADHVSMNLGQAVAVSLYEITRVADVEQPGKPEEPAPVAALNQAGDYGVAEDAAAGSANSDQAERLATALVAALLRSGYATPQSEAATLEKVRKLVRRMSLTSDDAELLLGMIKQIVWKLKSKNSSTPTEQESLR